MRQVQDLCISNRGAHYRGQWFPCAIGRGGIGDKLGEGDGITPKGMFQLAGIRYRADRVARPETILPARAIGPLDKWSDDPKDPAYNHAVRAAHYPFSHERLHRGDGLYDLFAVLSYNWPDARPGAGSAIFLHSWRKPRHPTEGCVAFEAPVLRYILQNWGAKARVIIA